MSRPERDKSEDITRPSCPTSKIVAATTIQEGLEMVVQLRERVEEARQEGILTKEQTDEVNRNLDCFAGPGEHSIDTGKLYAFLVQLGVEHEKAAPISDDIRDRCKEVVSGRPPVPPPNASGEHRVKIEASKVPRQPRPPFSEDN